MSSEDGVHQDPVAAVRHDDGAVIVALVGELDLYNANAVRQALVQACEEAQRVVVDLSDVRFIDSTALGVLIEGRSRLANRGAFFLAAPGMETRRALQVSGLDSHFAIVDTVESALAAKV